MKDDRYEEARDVVAVINGASLDDELVKDNLADIETCIQEDVQGQEVSWRDFFAHGKLQNWRRMLLIVLIEIMPQFTGWNMMYAPIPSLHVRPSRD
jgi:hypothetical protein